MDEQRIEMVLKLLGQCIPRAPEKTVEKMVKTVNALEEKRTQENDSSKDPKDLEAGKNYGLDNKGLGGPKL